MRELSRALLAGVRRGLRPALRGPPAGAGVRENVYGHGKRLAWIVDHLRPGDRVLEVGCGTGWFITRPLARLGFAAQGIDVHAESIARGRDALRAEGIDPSILRAIRLEEVEGRFDAIVCSEVLEHLATPEVHGLLDAAAARLAPGGTLLVTVPNGYGLFEVESALWFRTSLGARLERASMTWPWEGLLRRTIGARHIDPIPASLDASPHVQRFTLPALAALLAARGFVIVDATGTSLWGGPISNFFLSTSGAAQRASALLGSLVPWASIAFLVAARRAP